MADRIFSFRWDIDHIQCLDKGVPEILSVCREMNVKTTFYVTMGRAFNRREWLLKSFRKSISKLTDSGSVNIIKKLGYYDLFKLVLINQNIGKNRIETLKRIVDEGHELGLHGGMNHMMWSRSISRLSYDYIRNDIKKAAALLTDRVGIPLSGFSSPGFAWSEDSMKAVEDYGFEYNVDIEGDLPFTPVVNGRASGLLCIPATIIGPGTVPLIEHLSAKGLGQDEIRETVFEKILEKKFAVLYGHPFWEGRMPGLLRDIFRFVLDNKYRVMTHGEIFSIYKNRAETRDITR